MRSRAATSTARSALRRGLPVVGFSLITGLIMSSWLFPLARLPLPHGDLGQMAWNLWITTESIIHGESPYLTSMVYYPVGANLSTHTLAAGFFPVALVVRLMSAGDPLYPFYAYKVCVLLSFFLLLWLTWVFLREVGFSPLESFPPAVAFAFADYFVHQAVFLNIVAGFLIPLVAWLFLLAYRRPTPSRILLAAGLLGVTVYFSEFFVYLCLALALYVACLCALSRGRGELLEKVKAAGWGSLSWATFLFLAAISYFVWLWAAADPLPIDLQETQRFSANLAGFLIPHEQVTPLYAAALPGALELLNRRITLGMGGFMTFVGFPTLLLSLIGLRQIGFHQRIALVVAIPFLGFSLGPTIKMFSIDTGIPTPFTLLHFLPPFDQMGAPVRFVVIPLFVLTLTAASGMRVLLQRWDAGVVRRYAVGSVVSLWVLLEAYSPPTPHFGRLELPVERLQALGEGPVLSVPLDAYHGYHAALQTLHGQPISSGYLARRGRAQLEMISHLQAALAQDFPRLRRLVEEHGYRSALLVAEVPWLIYDRLERLPIDVVSLEESPYPPESVTLFRHPIAAGTPPTPLQRAAFELGATVRFAKGQRGTALLYRGWSSPEEWGVWSDGDEAELLFHLDEQEPLVLRLEGHTFGDQRLVVQINGHRLVDRNVESGTPVDLRLALPQSILQRENVLHFDFPEAQSAEEVGDPRRLALGLKSLVLERRPP